MGLDSLGKHGSLIELPENNGVRAVRHVQFGQSCDVRVSMWDEIVSARLGRETGEFAIGARRCRAVL